MSYTELLTYQTLLNYKVVVIFEGSVSHVEFMLHFSGDGLIKIWQENKVLLTEIHLEESLCSACFLNNTGDLLVGFKNHLFLINNKRGEKKIMK